MLYNIVISRGSFKPIKIPSNNLIYKIHVLAQNVTLLHIKSFFLSLSNVLTPTFFYICIIFSMYIYVDLATFYAG